MIRYPSELMPGVVKSRYKRFFADVELDTGELVTVHCPNPGSMRTSYQDGARCRVSDSGNPKRKLRMTLEQIQMQDTWIMVNPMLANKVVRNALTAGTVPELAGYAELLPEQRYGEESSRIDFLLRDEQRGQAWVEVKNVTMRQGQRGLFPDSVSARGARHLRELASVVDNGDRGVLLFHVGRADVDEISPAEQIDPTYAATLRDVVQRGVEVLAYRCAVAPDGLVLAERVPVVP